MDARPVTPLSDDPLEDAKQRLLKLVSRRDHSRSELERKLRTRGIAPTLVHQALDWAAENGYLDEQRYAEAYQRELSRKGYGPRMIQKKLFDKGVREAPESEAPVAGSLLAQASQLVLRRYGEPTEIDLDVRLKAARFLLRRGFDHATIRGVLGPLPRS